MDTGGGAVAAAARPGADPPDGSPGPGAPPGWRTFRSRVGDHVLVLEGSQVLDLPTGGAAGLGHEVNQCTRNLVESLR